jgi:pterin-4a-carbinolamine dehydratase
VLAVAGEQRQQQQQQWKLRRLQQQQQRWQQQQWQHAVQLGMRAACKAAAAGHATELVLSYNLHQQWPGA